MNRLLEFSGSIVLVLALVLGAGCAGAPPMPEMMEEGVPVPSEEYVDEERLAEEAASAEKAAIERKIVKTGYITLEVEDVAEAMDEVAAVADELHGYVVSSYKREEERGPLGAITIRVPAEEFDEAFERLRQLAVSAPYESTEARDVSEEYIDLEARLRNLEATEDQYLALLGRAETVEEMLKVQEALSNVRWEIERIEGRMKYLERTSDMSLINVELEETKRLAESWSASAAVRSAVRGLTAFGRGLATVLVWLGVFCWVWIPILIIWLRRRRRSRA
ncbi:MAG: DUF4349 domain-containing protein [Dehalococcoidia bacterium]|nr:DUF4349 domain-containing protein [Dehalococcoidia bacterium]